MWSGQLIDSLGPDASMEDVALYHLAEHLGVDLTANWP